MIDRNVFNLEIAILAEMHRHEMAAPTIDRYYELLANRMTTAQFVVACRRLAMTGRAWWPLPGDFLPRLEERLSTAELAAAAEREGLPMPSHALHALQLARGAA